MHRDTALGTIAYFGLDVGCRAVVAIESYIYDIVISQMLVFYSLDALGLETCGDGQS